MKVKIITLGCKVNAYESEFITELLKNNGYEIKDSNVDVIIVNTCSVTNQADAKSRKLIRKEKRENPEAIVVVCGCMAESHQNDLNDLDVDILIGNKDKSKIVELINNYQKDKKKYQKFYNLRDINFEDMTIDKYEDKTRAIVKIEDGCNNFCSYCIIPYVRGVERSKNFNTVIKEVNSLVNNNHQEIVFTGIHTGNYNNNGKRLVDIIKEVSKLDNLKRIRISSIEVTELDNDFLNELKINPKICNHLHIPLQNGSDKILKLMNRKYITDYFLNKINEIRKIRPDISVTTDIIVGFPNETEDDFNNTLNFSKKINFSKIHVFPYSKRNGTVAFNMLNQVSDNDKKKRTKELLNLSLNLEMEYARKFIGKDLEIIIEHSGDISSGHTSNYLEVFVEEKLIKNKIYQIKIAKMVENMLIGVIIE